MRTLKPGSTSSSATTARAGSSWRSYCVSNSLGNNVVLDDVAFDDKSKCAPKMSQLEARRKLLTQKTTQKNYP